MTEEINFSYDGGLYAELIRNRTFRDDPTHPVNWSVAKYGGGDGSIALDNDPGAGHRPDDRAQARCHGRLPAGQRSASPTKATGAFR